MKQSENPLFSIVIPTYNHGHLIGRCLESLLAQTYSNWEAIIVNNFSQDNTEQIVASFQDKRIKLINFANNGVIAASRNKGIREVQGEWVCFLDSDDWWKKDKLKECLKWLPTFDLIYHKMNIYSSDGKCSKTLDGRQIKRNILTDMLLKGNAVCTSSTVIRSKIVSEVGFMSEDRELIAVEDFDYWLRVGKVTTKWKYINKSLGYYWIGNSNVSFSENQIQRIEALYDRYLPRIVDLVLKQEIVCRLNYRLARIYQLLGCFQQARTNFSLSFKSRSFVIKLKTVLFLILIKWKSGE